MVLIPISTQIYQSFLEASENVEQIRSLCRVPAISFGILLEGKTIYTGSVGQRDMCTGERPDGDTLYTLCSVSKTFVSASIGILVDQGKMAWEDPVGDYLPEFRTTKGDLRVAKEATFNDFLRHSSGLVDPVVTMLGPHGTVLVPEKDFIGVANETPTADANGNPYFNRTWKYSNVAYGMMTLVVERISGVSYAEFVQANILNPLGMRHTAISEKQLETAKNVAHPYAQLSDRSWHRLSHEWTSEKNSPVLGMIGIRSSG